MPLYVSSTLGSADENASKPSHSEGTVKRVLHGVTGRLGLINWTHGVAYTMRSGALA